MTSNEHSVASKTKTWAAKITLQIQSCSIKYLKNLGKGKINKLYNITFEYRRNEKAVNTSIHH